MLTRRNFLAVTAAGTAALLVGCSGEKSEGPAATPATKPVEDAPAADAAPAGATLVAYFSATGNTEGVAAAITERLGRRELGGLVLLVAGTLAIAAA